MNPNGKYQGKTAKNILDLIQERWISFGDQVIQIDQVIEKARDSAKLLLGETRTEFAAMLDKDTISESDINERWRSYLLSEMGTRVARIFELIGKNKEQEEGLLSSLRPSFLKIQQWIQSSDIDSIVSLLPAMLEAQMNQIENIDREITQEKEYLEQEDNVSSIYIEERIDDESKTQQKISKPVGYSTRKAIKSLKDNLFSLKALMMSIQDPEETKIFTLSSIIKPGTDAHRDKIRYKAREIENIKEFIEELQYLSNEIRNNESLFEEPSSLEQQYMLNWIGGKAECKPLIKFLLNNGYLQGTNIDQYIAKHFLIDGKKYSPKAINGLHSEYNGGIEEYEGYLKIPPSKKMVRYR